MTGYDAVAPDRLIWHRGGVNVGLGGVGVHMRLDVFLCIRVCFYMFGYVCDVWLHLDIFGYVWMCLRCVDASGHGSMWQYVEI